MVMLLHKTWKAERAIALRDGRNGRNGKYDQPYGRKYFLMLSPSVLNSTLVPRCSRICLVLRLIMPWRLPDCWNFTFPLAVILKRFFAPDLVFNLGIWLSSSARRRKALTGQKCSQNHIFERILGIEH